MIDPEEPLLLWRASSSICYPSVMGELGSHVAPHYGFVRMVNYGAKHHA